jgi:hypothetical protein
MKYSTLLKLPVLSVILLGTLSMLTQTASAQSASAIKLDPPKEESLNRFGISFGMSFNATVDFKHFGAFAPPTSSRLTPDGDPFNYDDGYVLTDSSGNLLGYTRYWGYDSSSQVPGDGTILMHRASSTGGTAKDRDDDPQLGFEFTYNRELGRNEKLRWGLEAAFGYMNVSVNDSHPIPLTRLTDAYPLGLVVPPPAPYYHGANLSPEGNPVIGATPVTSTAGNVLASLTGPRNFDADLYEFRLGPYLEIPLGRKWAVTLSGGLALVDVNSDFSFKETFGISPVAGSGSHSDLLVGGYAASNISYKLNEAWGLFTGVQFHVVGNYSHRESGRTAVLNLGETVFLVFGASYSF